MRIVFIGTVEFSLCILKTLLKEKAEIIGVVTDRDRGINNDYADLEPTCKKYGIPVLFAKDINATETVGWIKHLSPDIIFCLGWSRLLKSEILQLAPMGVIGYHPSALPKNRGHHPLIWALILGLKSTASTFFLMDEGVDSGDIIDQRVIAISSKDDAGSLYAKLVKVAKHQIKNIMPLLISGQVVKAPQDHFVSNVWRKRSVHDGVIDWRMSASSIHNLIRGLAKPYIGAHMFFDGKMYKVWKSSKKEYKDVDNVEPGRVLAGEDEATLVVKCGEGAIELLSVEPRILVQKGDYI